jgi:putative tricarboxylic transport membrane protein
VARPTATPTDPTETAARHGEGDGAGYVVLTVAVPLLLLGTAAWVFVSSLGLGYWTPIGPGPGFFPMWLAALLGAMSIIWLVQLARRRSGSATAAPEDIATPGSRAMEGPVQEALNLTQVLAVLGSLVAVTALLTVLGFQLSMLLFLLFQLKVLARRGWLLSIALSVAGSFGVFTIFTQLLTVNLPTASIPLLRSMGL